MNRPSYWKEPITYCELCGKSLYDIDRYRVELVVRNGPLKGVVFKRLHLCEACLRRILSDRSLRKRFKIRYRKMKKLASYWI